MYQMVSPEALPSPRGGVSVRKPTVKSSKEDIHGDENGRIPTTATSGEDGSFEGNGGSTMTANNGRSPSSSNLGPSLQVHRQSPAQDNKHCNESVNHHGTISVCPRNSAAIGVGANGVGGDVLLQWGQRKRSRCTRPAEKILSNSNMRPPLSSPLASTANGRARVKLTPNVMLYGKDASGSGFISSRNNRTMEDHATSSPSRNCKGMNNTGSRSVGGTGKRSQSSSVERNDRRVSCNHGSSSRKGKCEDHSGHVEESRAGGEVVAGEGEKGNNGGGEVFEWPRIYVALSRKEKEDDFYAMKGTKLPHRPKKRSKAIDRTLQYCFPGLWLSDLTRARYEVRESKSKKPKRRGLRGLESIDSDSE